MGRLNINNLLVLRGQFYIHVRQGTNESVRHFVRRLTTDLRVINRLTQAFPTEERLRMTISGLRPDVRTAFWAFCHDFIRITPVQWYTLSEHVRVVLLLVFMFQDTGRINVGPYVRRYIDN